MWLTRNTNNKKKKIAQLAEDHLSLLARNARFKGAIKFEGTARIDGRLEGDISSNGVLLIGEEAVIEGNIVAGSVICCGKITGDIIAVERVELKVPAVLVGRVKTPRLALEEGVSFLGASEVQGDNLGVVKATTIRSEKVTMAPGLARSADLGMAHKRSNSWAPAELPAPGQLTGHVAI